MKVLIIGGAGMIGRKLAERLARDGELGGSAITQSHPARRRARPRCRPAPRCR